MLICYICAPACQCFICCTPLLDTVVSAYTLGFIPVYYNIYLPQVQIWDIIIKPTCILTHKFLAQTIQSSTNTGTSHNITSKKYHYAITTEKCLIQTPRYGKVRIDCVSW